MKIQLSQNRIVKDHITIWQEAGPEVDLTMDLKNLSFRSASINQICSIHVLDFLFPEEAKGALKNWYNCLKPGGKLFIVVDDFEYITRAFVGGDINIDVFNKHHSHASQFDQRSLGDMLITTGFAEGNIKVWFADVPEMFSREHYELVLEAQK